MLKRLRIFFSPDGPEGTPPASNNTDTPPAGDTPPAPSGTPGDTSPPAKSDPGSDKPPSSTDAPASLDGGSEPVSPEEKYKDFKFKDGFKPAEQFMDKFLEIAKEQKLTTEQSQKYIDLSQELIEHSLNDLEARETKSFNDQVAEWDKQLRADPEFGGLKYKETVERANRTLRRFTDMMGEDGKTLRSLFANKRSNHPAMFKFLALIDKSFGEATAKLPGTEPAGSKEEKYVGSNFYNK